MRHKYFMLVTATLLSCCVPLFGQTITYLNKFKHPVYDQKKYPPHYFELEFNQGSTIKTVTYTMDSVKVSDHVVIKNAENETTIENLTLFYLNGNIKHRKKIDHLQGQKTVHDYYENGALMADGKWLGEELKEASYFDHLGRKIEHHPSVNPVPKEGLEAWKAYLNKIIKYPLDAKKWGMESKVWVQFIVTTEGKITNLEAMNPEEVYPLLIEEAFRAIKSYRQPWIPGSLNGKLISNAVQIPITFELVD